MSLCPSCLPMKKLISQTRVEDRMTPIPGRGIGTTVAHLDARTSRTLTLHLRARVTSL